MMKKYHKPRTRNTDCSGNDMIASAWKSECEGRRLTKEQIDALNSVLPEWCQKRYLDGTHN